jgi:hypothetical protein
MAVSRHHLRSQENQAFLLPFVHTTHRYYRLNGSVRPHSQPRQT